MAAAARLRTVVDALHHSADSGGDGMGSWGSWGGGAGA